MTESDPGTAAAPYTDAARARNGNRTKTEIGKKGDDLVPDDRGVAIKLVLFWSEGGVRHFSHERGNDIVVNGRRFNAVTTTEAGEAANPSTMAEFVQASRQSFPSVRLMRSTVLQNAWLEAALVDG